ncbi:putative porin [Flavobacterium sp. I3-2]|uniref:putative porin n=1 Tax=Flavobacterium sp. I3-2 TaxID=2748319 RepID=UPI0015B107AA|nr:putative porin [Flavobacterium sp. I3-2]
MSAQVKRTDKLKIKDEKNVKIDNTKVNQTNNNPTTLNNTNVESKNSTTKSVTSQDSIAPIDWYKIISYDNKITEVDTALTIKKFQQLNFLGRDMFGLQSLSNDGQTYNVLDYSLINNHMNPSFGFSSKQWNYYQIEDINYYKVPTPFTELSYRSVVKQGQNLNTLFTTNFNERTNVFIGYRALRSLGAYLNELNSIGNFKLGGSYNTKDEKYYLQMNFVFQDIMNQENGGITDIDLFESSDAPYNNRERLNVYMRNANSLFKGTRAFLNHKYQFNSSTENEIWVKHKFFYEYQSNEFNQTDLTTFESSIRYFGDSYSNSIKDKVRFKNFYNQLSLAYNSTSLGELAFNTEISSFDYYYNSIVVKGNSEIVPAFLKYDLVTLGGSYGIDKEDFSFNAEARQSISEISTTELKAEISYDINDLYTLKANYQYLSKIPEMTQQMFQSTYVDYNWINNFSNEKIQSINATFENPYVNLSGNFQLINDKIYFSNNNLNLNAFAVPEQQLVTPKQYDKTIGYFNIKAQREFKFGKFALDNTLLFQQVTQDENIVNVPSFITRNTIYYTDKLFKKALFLQTGIVFKYHTKYYANEYNPILGDYFVQDSRKIGGFPTFDFFVNAKIKTARIYLNLEHFNSSFTGYNFFATPTRPFTDMRLRFGIVWDFFW